MAFQDAYGTGGVAIYSGGNSSDANTGSGFLGRVWNNMTGKTAQNEYNMLEAEKARLFNSAEAQKERDWQTLMSNTAYQRSVADMKSAGINPASLGGSATGSPASSGSGASASGYAASNHGSGGSFFDAVLNGLKDAAYFRASRSAFSASNAGKGLREAVKTDAAVNSSSKVRKQTKADIKKQDEEIDAMLKDLGLVDQDYKYPGDKGVSFDGRDIEYMKRYNKNYNWYHHRAGSNSDG